MEAIENVDLDKRIERERFWIENTEKCVNRQIPGRSQAEYRQDNKERILENNKACYLANRERRLEHQKAYNLANKERVSEHQKACYLANREQRLEYQKAYKLANRERVSEYQKAYNLANSDKIKARTSERITCPTCGKNLVRKSLARHNKLHL
jgi:hypothetical protein